MIRLVEAWDRNGDASLVAILAQARALLGLRLMDRAWVRLREASRVAADDPEVLALTARVFIDRGWPGRARGVVEQLELRAPDHPELSLLRRQAQEPPAGPPADAREVERSGSPAQLLALAEAYLATGSFLRARSILERVRRAEPMNRRVELLLWGLQGDFLPRGRSLSDLVRDAAPSAEWESPDHTESLRRAPGLPLDPPTAEVTRGDLVALGLADPAPSGAFHGLFRRVGGEVAGPDEEGEEEVTAAAGLATRGEMRSPPQAEVTDPGLPSSAGRREDEGGDTQIMQVIPGPGGTSLAEVDGPIHHAAPGSEGGSGAGAPGGALRETLDLRAWQQSMGMEVASGEDGTTGEGEDFLEAEDQDVVVLTRREPGGAPLPPPTSRSGRIEVIEKRPVPEVEPPSAPSPAPSPPPEPDRPVVLDPTPPAGARWPRVVALALAMALVMAFATGGAVRYLHAVVAERQLDEAERSLAAGDYRGLLELAARLDAAVRGEVAPVSARALALAMVEAVLWAEYTGDPAQLERARQALGVALEKGASGRPLALAEGTLALLEGDLERAAVHSVAVGTEDPGGRYLAARLAMAQGDAGRALELWGAEDAVEADGIRHRLLRERILRAAGQEQAAQAAAERLLQAAGDNPLVMVAAAAQGWTAEDVPARLTLVEQTLRRLENEAAPRQLAELHLARARVLIGEGRSDEALDALRRAAAVDGGHPEVLYALAGLAVGRNQLLAARDELARCLEGAPHHAACQRGAVQVDLDLDRVESADQVAGLATGTDGVRLRSWVRIAAGGAAGTLHELVAAVEADTAARDGLAVYLLGLTLAEDAASADRAERALALAQRILSPSPDPLDRVLAARAAAMRARLGSPADAEARAQEAMLLAPSDPGVHVELARRLEGRGQRGQAGQHLERATALGPEHAMAWYARGQFWYTPGGMEQARSAWRRYLELSPSGERAGKVASRLR